MSNNSVCKFQYVSYQIAINQFPFSFFFLFFFYNCIRLDRSNLLPYIVYLLLVILIVDIIVPSRILHDCKRESFYLIEVDWIHNRPPLLYYIQLLLLLLFLALFCLTTTISNYSRDVKVFWCNISTLFIVIILYSI